VACVALLPECRRASAFSADGRMALAPLGCGWLAGWLADWLGWRHARARITQVCLVIAAAAAAAAADDLLVITRPHRTQLYLPTQSISQGTATHAKLAATPSAGRLPRAPRNILRAAGEIHRLFLPSLCCLPLPQK